MTLQKLLKKSKIAKTPNMKKSLIRFVSFTILVLILLNIVLFYLSMRDTYIEQMESSNDSIIEQVAISHEMLMKYIRDSVYKTALYDNELITLVQSYDSSNDSKIKTAKKLNSLILLNEFIHSAYLYFPEFDQVFNTFGNMLLPLYEFSDKEAFFYINDKSVYSLDPRNVTVSTDVQQLIASEVAAVPLSNQGKRAFLVINVDAKKMYYDIMKKIKADGNMNFFTYNEKNLIIIHQNEAQLFHEVKPDRFVNKVSFANFYSSIFKNNLTLTSTHYSRFLKWTFVLETSLHTPKSLSSKLSWFLTICIVLIVLSLAVTVFLINFYTRPVKGILQKYGETLLKEFLTDSTILTDETRRQLEAEELLMTEANYGIIALQINQNEVPEKTMHLYTSKLKEYISKQCIDTNLMVKVLLVQKNTIALIASFSPSYEVEWCGQVLKDLSLSVCQNMPPSFCSDSYIGVSLIKDHLNLLPLAYKEATDVFKYKLSFSSHLMNFSDLRDKISSYEYPHALERQLLNNIQVGNREASLFFLNEFFSTFQVPNCRIEDNEIKSSIYHLQNTILKSISGLPIPVKINVEMNLFNIFEMEKIREKVTDFVSKVNNEINQKDENEEFRLYNTVLEYMEKNFVKDDFSLNKAADNLNINRNYLSKIIREKTGENFTDYVNQKRIALAKELLFDKKKTIEDIAKQVGFNYSYYFIKIFKSTEGVTPGQYRSANIQKQEV